MNKFRSLFAGLAVAIVAAAAVTAFSASDREAKQGLIGAGLVTFGFIGMTNTRTLRDLNLKATIALPAAAAANYTAGIDTVNANPGRLEDCELLLECPATPSLVDAKTIIFTIKDSPDNVTFTALADLPTVTITGAGGAGAAAVSRNFKIPIGANRYLRADAAVLTAGGDNTAVSYSLSLVF